MHKCDGRMHFSEALMHDEIAPSTHWHYTLAQLYRRIYVVAKIKWNELSHMGLGILK